MKKISAVIYGTIVAVLVFVGVATTFSLLDAPGGYRLYVVLSGSMEPVIRTGSLAVVVKAKSYGRGDIITFYANPNTPRNRKNPTITHRIVSVKDENGQQVFQTKGDANKTPDQETVRPDQILGKSLFSIPYIGHVVGFAKTQTGLIVLVIIPATLIIYGELMNIKKEIQNRIGRKNTNDSDHETRET